MYNHLKYGKSSQFSAPVRPQNVLYTINGMEELEPNDYCYIDCETARTLELVENNVDITNRKHSLLGFFNTSTSTTTGTRMLRDAILRPLCNCEILEQRLDCVEYLTHRIDSLSMITNCIKKYGCGVDLENVAPCLISLFNSRQSSLHIAERRLDALSTLSNLISQVSALVATLESTDQPLLNALKIVLQDATYEDILTEINSVIDCEEASRKTKSREYASSKKRNKITHIRTGVDRLFDLARSTYSITLNELENYVRDLSRDEGLPWKLNYNESRGYYLIINANLLPKTRVLGPQYLRVEKTRTTVSCTTKDLMQSNVRANVSYENSMKLGNEVLKECFQEIINNISAIYRLVEVVGTLDLMTSFAKQVLDAKGRMVRPKFSPSDTLISAGRHPVLESALRGNSQTIVPNDVMLTTNRQNMMLVTGPNMGGKSVFLRQLGLIQIMAQIGSFVPADSALIKLVGRVVARCGSSDDDNSSCSSFMSEMRGIARALKLHDTLYTGDPIDPSTLYLVDEVGRGTSIDDGTAYSFAIAEHLALQKDNFSIFATHFDQVFTLTKLYYNVSAYHFKYEEDEECDEDGRRRQKLSHELVPGSFERVNYGIKLAEICGLPEEILNIAKVGIVCGV